MSEPQLKLVWVNNLVMATSSEKRKQKADALKREDSNETKDSAKLEDSDGIKDSGWTSSFDRKQIVSTLVGVIAGTILGVLGAAGFGMSMSSENWENRLIKKWERVIPLQPKSLRR